MTVWPVTPPSPLYDVLSREVFTALPLMGTDSADVVVIGGGVAGLSAAWHLHEAGQNVALLEAGTVGCGASGRNNGQIIPTLTRHDPVAIKAIWGEETGEHFLLMLEKSADLLYDIVNRYRIDCDLVQHGWFQPAHSPGRVRAVALRAEQWQRRGVDTAVLSRQDVLQHLGGGDYAGGWWHSRGGHFNPLAFVRGFARNLVETGVRIYEHSPALTFQRYGKNWIVHSKNGKIVCKKIVFTTGAYTSSLWKGLSKTIVPVTSYQFATSSLGSSGADILPYNEACSDTRNDLRYFRKDREGRLITGGALAIQALAHKRLGRKVRGLIAKTFPSLTTFDLSYFWEGRIAMTPDRLPHLHSSGDGLVAWIGCNGRGLALSMGMGAVVRDVVLEKKSTELALPLTPLSPIHLHGVIRRSARMLMPYYRCRDKMEV